MSESEKKTVAAAPTRAQFIALNKVANIGEMFEHPEFKKRIAAAAPQHMHAERLLRTFVLAVQKTPKLAKVSPMSMLGAFITLASLGLEPNTPLGHAYLIPFGKRGKNPNTGKWEEVAVDVQVIIGYQGFLDLIYRGDKVLNVHCDVVWKGDHFSYKYGTNQHLDHVPACHEHATDEEPKGAYMYAKLKNGGEEFCFMSLADLHAIRARSQGYMTAMKAHDDARNQNNDPMKDKRYSEAPWIKDRVAMYKKTALRAGRKYLPVSIELAAAVELDSRADNGSIDFSTIIDGDSVMEASYGGDEEQAAPQLTEEQTIPVKVPAADRMPDPARTRQATAEGHKRTRVAATTIEAPEPASDPETGEITYPMFNHFGEEDEGPFGVETDPVEFAKNLTQAWNNTVPESRVALIEANVESLEAARSNPEAKKRLDTLVGTNVPAKATADEERFNVPRVKTHKGSWDVVAWTKAAQALISTITDRKDLAKFVEVNAETLAKLPATAKSIIDNYAGQKMVELSEAAQDAAADDVPLPEDEGPGGEEPPPIEARATKDEWEVSYASFLVDFTAATSLGDLTMISANAAMKVKLRQIKENRPDLAEKLGDAYRKREAELKAAQ